METVVEAIDLLKVFDDGIHAVDGISFKMKKGEVLGLLGPNGAGKTTTMHMLLGLTTPTSGRVCVLDIDINGKKRAEALQRVNFSSSYVSLPYSLTVVENLTVFSRLYRIKNRKEKIAELMDIFGLNGIRNEPTRRLSSGQITRVSLAKSLLNDPEVLFLDEPTASLDPDMADRTRTLLRKIGKERGMSMLYTSHNMAEMEEICDRIIFLNHGKIIAEGRSEDVVRSLGGTSLEDAFLKVARRERGENVGG